jgi:hypothetical protein
MLERGKPIVMAMGEGVGDSSTTRSSTIKARKDAERKRGERRALYIPLIRPLSRKSRANDSFHYFPFLPHPQLLLTLTISFKSISILYCENAINYIVFFVYTI